MATVRRIRVALDTGMMCASCYVCSAMAGSETKTILIVEDDSSAREAMSEFLELHGYTVASAANGQDALDEIESHHLRPVLILLDMLMPVMDGRDFLRRARQDNRISDVPIIVTTAHPSSGMRGATAMLIKPVRPERLLSLVRQVLQAHNSGIQ